MKHRSKFLVIVDDSKELNVAIQLENIVRLNIETQLLILKKLDIIGKKRKRKKR